MIRLHLRLNWKSTLLWTLILSAILFGFMAFYPSMANDSMKELVDGKLNGLPDSILSIVGFETFPDFTNINVFYGYIMQYVLMALAVFSLTLGLNSYLKEEKEGTIEFLFALPQSRLSLIINKCIANIILVFILVTALIIVSLLSFALFRPTTVELSTIISDNLFILLSFYLLALVYLSLGTALSMILPSNLSMTGIAMALVFIPYLIGTMSIMIQEISFLKGISLLHTLMPNQIHANNVNLLSLVLWIALSVLLFGFGTMKFKHRDIQI